jgi:hypothetical protein
MCHTDAAIPKEKDIATLRGRGLFPKGKGMRDLQKRYALPGSGASASFSSRNLQTLEEEHPWQMKRKKQ